MTIQRGDMFQLGVHRLLCGDATNKDDVLKLVGSDKVNLVLTDPPYGIKIQHKDGGIGGAGVNSFIGKKYERNKFYKKFQGDEDINTAKNNYAIVKDISDVQIIWGGQYFVHFLPVSGGWLFWDKERPSKLKFGAGELAWCSNYTRVKKYSQKSNSCILQGTRVLNPIPRLHPTQKPVELHMKILEDFSKPNDVILDCFGGSGTTLIACNETNRKCLIMEISPDYCQIIINRYEKLIGFKAEKVN